MVQVLHLKKKNWNHDLESQIMFFDLWYEIMISNHMSGCWIETTI